MSRSNVALVTSSEGDWEGLYVDGELVAEDHSIPTRWTMLLLAKEHVEVGTFSQHEVDQEWLEENSGATMPHFFSELPEDCRQNGETTP